MQGRVQKEEKKDWAVLQLVVLEFTGRGKIDILYWLSTQEKAER